MTRRERSLWLGSLLGVVVALAGGAAVWFALTRQRPQPPPEPPTPAGPKTTAELLVGTWKQIRHNHPGLPVTYTTTIEYTRSNRFRVWTYNPPAKPLVTGGTYRVEGDTIRKTYGNGEEAILHIERLTEDTLVIGGEVGTDWIVHEYQRLQQK